jgi:hypothetical protein
MRRRLPCLVGLAVAFCGLVLEPAALDRLLVGRRPLGGRPLPPRVRRSDWVVPALFWWLYWFHSSFVRIETTCRTVIVSNAHTPGSTGRRAHNDRAT